MGFSSLIATRKMNILILSLKTLECYRDVNLILCKMNKNSYDVFVFKIKHSLEENFSSFLAHFFMHVLHCYTMAFKAELCKVIV